MLGTRLIYFPQCPCVKSRMSDAADWGDHPVLVSSLDNVPDL
jgi:hypothetical protein